MKYSHVEMVPGLGDGLGLGSRQPNFMLVSWASISLSNFLGTRVF